ncbi:hypothetical protein [Microbacterium sp. Root180]|uniref:hypothetical protein n=1 Tax=Microbacterium sp. Root180 TaxID=1736483 RepID=UPI0007004B68|nr:hypothetical protein [Microbacterium sp. Root180]KRB38816.1 hypothetical protein ASD93_02430 [Microbacterium sp. Root180]
MVRPFRTRDEPALSGSDFVVRGGPLDRDATERTFNRCVEVHGVPAISVAAAAGLDPEQIIEESKILRNLFSEYLWCHVSDLWNGNYSLLATNARPHYSLILPGDLDNDTWEDLAERFRPL